MPNFNTQTEAQIKTDMTTHGFTWKETTNSSAPLDMYFEDANNVVVFLSVDAASSAAVFQYWPAEPWRDQFDLFTTAVVTDLASLDALIIPKYVEVNPILIKVEESTDVTDRDVMTQPGGTYYTATVFQDASLTNYNVSEDPSSYRDNTVIWVPVVVVGPNWVLVNDNAKIVNTADVFSVVLGDYVILKP